MRCWWARSIVHARADVKAVLVLGLGEGVFPSVPREDSVLCDADRREFHRRNLDVSPATDRRLLDENLLGIHRFHQRVASAVRRAVPLADAKGKPLGPSVFWRRLTKLFPGIQPTVLPREQRDAPSLIATPRQLVTSLMRWVRASRVMATEDAATPWPALYQWLATHPHDGSPIDAMRFGGVERTRRTSTAPPFHRRSPPSCSPARCEPVFRRSKRSRRVRSSISSSSDWISAASRRRRCFIAGLGECVSTRCSAGSSPTC